MQIGDIIAGRFVLLERAGTGGMGTVFRAEDRRTGQLTAVKVLRDNRRDDVRRFEREAKLLSDIRHPRIVRHVAHGVTEQGDLWLAMDWLSGEDLNHRLERGPLSIEESVAVARAVAEGLACAHALGIIHRDLKPANVLLVHGDIEGATLLDFGLARRDGLTRLTQTGNLLGTPGYMAPEQVRGQDLSPAADVYALGCVLYRCLAGEPLFKGEHIVALLARTLFDEAPRARDRLRRLPPSLCDLLDRMLSREPSARPRDGAEVAAALAALGPMPDGKASPVAERDTASVALPGSEQRSMALLLVGAARELSAAQDEALIAEARRHGGHGEQLQDGTLSIVLAGSTPVLTDLAAQAARCALALQRLAPERPLVLSMGRVELSGRLPIGQIIDRAAHLFGGLSAESHDAGPGETLPILLDNVAAGLLDARFDVREQTGSFVLLGERELAEGTRTLLGKATPCVGRERELRQLERMLDDCVKDSVAHVLLVTAPAGTGKTRLGQEFLRIVKDRAEGAQIWIGRGGSLRAGSPLGLLAQALRGACGVREGDPLEARRDRLTAVVAERVSDKDRRRAAELLGEMIGAPFEDAGSPLLSAARSDAQLMSEQMRAAFLDFIAGTCERAPLVLLLEDMHWGDRASAQFIDHALKELEERPLFVLALARPEVNDAFPDLWAQRRRQDIRLREVPRKAIERLAGHVLGDRADPKVIERLAKLSDGNAFYLEELLRWAAEGDSGELPQTVVAMVEARLSALDDESRRVLRAASVFGEVTWPGAVAALLGGAERGAAVRERLSSLCEDELLLRRRESRFEGEEELMFRHALLREGAYAMLTAEDLSLGHRLAGEWLERRGERDSLLLAEHFDKGGDGERAAQYYLRAAEQAHDAGDSAAALQHARRGLERGASGELRIALLGLICGVRNYSFSFREALPYALELIERAPPGSVPWLQAVMVDITCALQTCRAEEIDRAMAPLLKIEATVENARAFAMTFGRAIHILELMGRIRESDRMTEHYEASLGAVADRAPAAALALSMSRGARAHLSAEDPAYGLACLEPVARAVEAIGLLGIAAVARQYIEMHRWLLGSCEESSLGGPGAPGEWTSLAHSVRPWVLAWLHADRGRLEEAQSWAEVLVEIGRTMGMPSNEGRGRWALSEVLRRVGDLEAAETEIIPAIALLRQACPIDVPGALATLAALCIEQGRPADGVTAAEEGLAMSEAMGACTHFMRGAFLRLVYAECLEAAREHEKARIAIAEARRRVLINADKIADPAYRASFLENVPENRRTLELAGQWLGEGA